jgi:hypothetical protein
MQIISVEDVPNREPQQSFTEGGDQRIAWPMTAWFLCIIAIFTPAGFFPWSRFVPTYVCFIVAFAFGILSGIPNARRRSLKIKSNWILRVVDQSLYLHFRGAQNSSLPRSDFTVMELGYDEVRWIRKANVQTVIDQRSQQTGAKRICVDNAIYLEIGVAPSVVPDVERVLQKDRRLIRDEAEHSDDFPVWIAENGAVRVRWCSNRGKMTLKIGFSMFFLKRVFAVTKSVASIENYTLEELRKLGVERQRAKLKVLARFEPSAAINTAAGLYRYSTESASLFVNALDEE